MNPISPKTNLTAEERLAKIEKLHEEYAGLMFTIARRVLRDKNLAEDALQQSFVRVITHLHKIDETNVPATKSFMAIIARNVAINMYHKMGRLNKHSDAVDKFNEPCPKYSPDDLVIDNESVQRIVKAIEELPIKYRDAMFLKYFHNFSIIDMTKILNEPYDTIQKRLYRAKNMLRKTLEREGIQ